MSTADGDAIRTSTYDLPANPDPTSPAIQRAVDGALLICLAVLAVLIAVGVHGPLRVVMAFVFAMLAPGWVVTGYLCSLPLYARVVASVGASIGICITVTSIALWLHWWHPKVIFLILGTFVGLALLLRCWISWARTRDHEQGESEVVVE